MDNDKVLKNLLPVFLKDYMLKNGMVQQKSLADRHLEIVQNKEERIDEAVISRLLKNKNTAREETVKKIAQIVLNKKDAKAEELWKIISENKEELMALNVEKLRVATGFTVWASYCLNLVYSRQMPSNIEITFCDEKQEDGLLTPFFVKSQNDINQIKLSDSKSEDKYRHKYIADDLKKLLDSNEVDCAFLLRTTFQGLYGQNPPSPLMYCRIAVGYGTHISIIKVKEKRDDEILKTYDKKKEEFQKKINKGIRVDPIESILDDKKSFCDLIQGYNCEAVFIGNSTIEKQIIAFTQYESVINAVNNPRIPITRIDLETEQYNSFLEERAEDIESGKLVLLVAAFEPLNNILLHDIKKIIERKNEKRKKEIEYYNFNLSKLLNDKSGYCLFVSDETIRNPNKLKKINELLEAIDTNKNKNDMVVNNLWDLYYLGDENEEIKIRLMREALNELEFRNHYLPFVKLISEIISE